MHIAKNQFLSLKSSVIVMLINNSNNNAQLLKLPNTSFSISDLNHGN